MANRRGRGLPAEIAFDALSIEGALLPAEWLGKVARLSASRQAEADYRTPKGLNLRDEIGRYWRIAQAHWSELQAGRRGDARPDALSARFVTGLLRDAFGFASLEARSSTQLGDRIYPIAAFAVGDRVPIVVAPDEAGLDTQLVEFGDDGRRRSAFGLLQEFLNASDKALWGIACDGATLRVGRDNASLTRPAWIQADLGRIFTEALYPDFAALWLLLHETRFGSAKKPPESCPLETWRTAGREEGTRARDRLRGGFQEALKTLGDGFLAQPGNTALRAALHDGTLTRQGYFGELLRVVYRLIFLLAVEERGLLHPPGTPTPAREIYRGGYSMGRLRDRSVRRGAHDRHLDAWEAVLVVFRGLGAGEPALGLPALAGLFSPRQCPHLDAAVLENRSLYRALFHLCWLREPTGLVRVNWRDMGADELGYIYEGLLELVPQISRDGRSFAFAGDDESRGHARKTTGSYYTPDELVQVLIDSALVPVIERTIATHPEDPAAALLAMSVVDPACGSGHFLLAAARKIAESVARLRAGGSPTNEDYRHALREVVRHCIYGVDVEPLAVELCKVSLWLEAIDPGMPLTFLEAHIRHGNALLGTTRALMGDHIPDDAWVALEGDDKKIARALKSRNRAERSGQLLLAIGRGEQAGGLQGAVEGLEAAPDEDAPSLAAKESRWQEIQASADYLHHKRVADAWCAAFFWPKQAAGPVVDAAPTTAAWRALRDGGRAPRELVETVARLADEYALFHWELAFPHVFARGGFDVVLGNPPWERVKLQEKEFFATRAPSIAKTKRAAIRKKQIAALVTEDPGLWGEWTDASRVSQATSHFARASGRYPLCGQGDINTYALFAEHNWRVLGPIGRAGFIVPSGIATDTTTREYFQAIVQLRALRSLWEFENEGFFTAGKGHMLRFALTTLSGSKDLAPQADFLFQGRAVTELDDPDRHFTLTAEDIATLNPNTGTCPIFRTKWDASLSLAIYRRAGVFWQDGSHDGNPWGLRFTAMFHMTSDSKLFHSRGELKSAGWTLESNRFVKGARAMAPLYEAKMVYTYNHRAGSFASAALGDRPHRLPEPKPEQLADPDYVPIPCYWVSSEEVDARLDGQWSRGWCIGWRDVTDARASARTVVPYVFPRAGVGNTIFMMFPTSSPARIACLYGNLSSFVLDYAARQKVGGLHLTYAYMKQLPVMTPLTYERPSEWDCSRSVEVWLLPRVLELTYTAWDLQPFAEDCGDEGAPFVWDLMRRFQLQCEIDAAFFRLYGISREDVGQILDTFPVVRRAEKKAHGEFRSKRVILEVYDALAAAAASGRPYVSPLPPPQRAS